MKITETPQDQIMAGIAQSLKLMNGLLSMVMCYLGITWMVQGTEYIVRLFQ